jgi:hypothetical protein
VPGPDLGLPIWYRDSDGDGQGDAGDTTCASSMPTGYVDNDLDCCDSEADVYDGQTTYFCSSFTCAGSSTPSWDYNCGGADIQRWQRTGRCYWGSSGCNYRDGWRYGYPWPDCGVSEDFVTGCDTSCNEVYGTQCQECR